jgi:hypothetical protein
VPVLTPLSRLSSLAPLSSPPSQVLQVYRSCQCAFFSGMGLFSMGVLHGQGMSLSAQVGSRRLIRRLLGGAGKVCLAPL